MISFILIVFFNVAFFGGIIYFIIKKSLNSAMIEDIVNLQPPIESLNLEFINVKSENLGVYVSSENDVFVRKSDGNLVPFGLSDEEKKTLDMFYSD